jgi:hypothetical protein
MLFILPAIKANADGSFPIDAKAKKLIVEIANASRPADAERGYVQLFRGANLSVLRRLKSVSSQGAALRIAWEELQRSGIKHQDDFVDTNPDPVAVARFLGFVEGRIGCSLPNWWENSVRTSYYEPTRKLWSNIEDFPYHDVDLSPKHKIWIPNNTTIKKDGDGVRISVASDSVCFPASAVWPLLTSNRQTTVCITDDCGLFAAYSHFGQSFPLVCINRKDGRKRWENIVWSCARRHQGGYSLPPICQHVDVHVEENQIYVFGGGYFGWFIEAFDLTTGRAFFRFASSYHVE